LGRIERLTRAIQLVSKRGAQPIGAGASVALQQQHAVDDLSRRIAPRRAHRAAMQPELRQYLTAREAVILDDKIGFPVIRPVDGGIDLWHRRASPKIGSRCHSVTGDAI
jgi:hypothetical protein